VRGLRTDVTGLTTLVLDRASVFCGLTGLFLIALGGIGLVFSDLLRIKFDPAHDLFHLVTGAAAIYCVVTEKEWLATFFPVGIGTLYLFLGIGGIRLSHALGDRRGHWAPV
jgi:hypothetical protein